MPSSISSCGALGLTCNLVTIEAEIVNGISSFEVVGLPDTAVKESKQRVYSAMKNAGAEFPRTRKIINLAPAHVPKHGAHFDLPIAVALLVASKQLSQEFFEKTLVVGELGLSGEVRKVRGVLPMVSFAKRNGFKNAIVPKENALEASLIQGMTIFGIEHLKEVIAGNLIAFEDFSQKAPAENKEQIFGEIKGHAYAKRILEVAAAGGHNVLMCGPPGSGKTMLARALPELLPEMSLDEALEVSKIYSVAGLLSDEKPLITKRPFRSVHHTASIVSLIGGGAKAMPGEITLAHRGILFLDELPEFPRGILEAMRQPLEDGAITINRAHYKASYPSRFMFIASMNPCPCGYYGDTQRMCACSPSEMRSYSKKLSGPILDRIDMFAHVPRLSFEKLSDEESTVAHCGEEGQSPQNRGEARLARESIRRAREIQKARFENREGLTNAEMGSKETRRFCAVPPEAKVMLKRAVETMHLSPRAYFRVLKVARTIADLEGGFGLETGHVAEALQYRPKTLFE